MGAGSEPVKLKLTTMMRKDSIVQSERVSGLRVGGFSSKSFVNLPPAYTREFIPLERSHIPTPETAKRWRHLNQIAQKIPELMKCEVGLLIGYDCPRTWLHYKLKQEMTMSHMVSKLTWVGTLLATHLRPQSQLK